MVDAPLAPRGALARRRSRPCAPRPRARATCSSSSTSRCARRKSAAFRPRAEAPRRRRTRSSPAGSAFARCARSTRRPRSRMAALMTGLPPGERRARLLSAPMLPEFAHAAGIDTAFWTAQNLLFANTGRFLDGLPLSGVRERHRDRAVRDLRDGRRRRRLLDRALADLPRLREPYLAVAQLSNTHFPYVVDDRRPAVLEHVTTGGGWTGSGRRRFAIATRSTARTSSSRAFSAPSRHRRRGADRRRLPVGSRRAARRARAHRAHVDASTTRRSACRCGSTRRRERSPTTRPRASRAAGHAPGDARRRAHDPRSARPLGRSCHRELAIAHDRREPPSRRAAAAIAPLVMTNCSEIYSCAARTGARCARRASSSRARTTGTLAMLRRRRRSRRDARSRRRRVRGSTARSPKPTAAGRPTSAAPSR